MTYRHNWSCGAFSVGSYPNYIHTTHVTRYHRIDIPWSVELEIEELKKQYQEFTRDGHWNETGRNTGFKQAANKHVRLANKQFCSAILRGEDYDNKIYPHDHLGDYLVWSFW